MLTYFTQVPEFFLCHVARTARDQGETGLSAQVGGLTHLSALHNRFRRRACSSTVRAERS